jgi:hypothetical protein
MNTERLYSLVSGLVKEDDKHNFVNLLQNIESTYVQAVQTPNTDNSTAFENAMELLRSATVECPLDNLSPGRRNLIKAIGGFNYYGDNLLRTVKEIIEKAETPSSAIKDIQKLRMEMQEYLSNVRKLNEGLTKLE